MFSANLVGIWLVERSLIEQKFAKNGICVMFFSLICKGHISGERVVNQIMEDCKAYFDISFEMYFVKSLNIFILWGGGLLTKKE